MEARNITAVYMLFHRVTHNKAKGLFSLAPLFVLSSWGSSSLFLKLLIIFAWLGSFSLGLPYDSDYHMHFYQFLLVYYLELQRASTFLL